MAFFVTESALVSQSIDRNMSNADERAFVRRLYEAHFAYVWNTLRRLGVREKEREDVAHEVFIIVQRKAKIFDQTRPEKPWLFGIAYRVAADHRRLARHSRETTLDIEPEAQGDRADVSLEAKQRRVLIETALQTLPMDQRAVFIMHDIDELSVPEIATSLAVPLNTAYSRLRLGREAFAEAVRRLRAKEVPPKGTSYGECQ